MYNAAKIISFFFLPQEVGGFGNSIEKKLQKPRPKLKKKCVYYMFTECLQSNASDRFRKYVLIFWNNDSNFSL